MANNSRSAPSGPQASRKYVVALDHGTVTAQTVDTATVELTGVRTTDVIGGVNAVQKAGLAFGGARVVSADVAEISLSNPTAGNITTGTVTYTIDVGKFSSAS